MTLLQMSISGAAIVLTAAVLRAMLLNMLPKRTFLALWWVAILRLLVPFSILSPLSLYTLLAYREPAALVISLVPQPTTATAPPADAALQLPVKIRDAAETATAIQSAARHIPSFSPWLIVWATGAALCAAALAWLYWRCQQKFRTALPATEPFAQNWKADHPLKRPLDIRQSGRIASPITYGIFHPVILLPKNTNWNNERRMEYILLHEYIHICRWDAAAKLVIALVLCIHWFNPAVWVLYILFNRDIELACDEGVLRQLSGDRRADYARTLIDLEAGKSGLMPLYSGFGQSASEERIVAIMKTKKTTVFAAVLACVLVCLVAGVLATSPKVDETGTSAGIDIIQSQQKSLIEYTYGNEVFILTAQEFKERIPVENIEWWTYEDYKKYVERERARAESLIEKDRWSDKMAETYMTPYEQTLKALEEGYMLTKSSEGNKVSLLYTQEEYQQERYYTTSGHICTPYSNVLSTKPYQFIFESQKMQEEIKNRREDLWNEALAPYAAFGVTWKWDKKWNVYRMYYQGQEVRCIYEDADGACISEAFLRGTAYYRDNIDLYAVYENGQLAGVRLAAGEECPDWTETWQRLNQQAEQDIAALESR